MLDQGDVIKRIDHDSWVATKTLTGTSGKNRIVIIFRLMFLPVIGFIRTMVFGKGSLDGSHSLYNCLNEAALKFTTEAKRYENIYGDNIKAVKDSRDFR